MGPKADPQRQLDQWKAERASCQAFILRTENWVTRNLVPTNENPPSIFVISRKYEELEDSYKSAKHVQRLIELADQTEIDDQDWLAAEEAYFNAIEVLAPRVAQQEAEASRNSTM